MILARKKKRVFILPLLLFLIWAICGFALGADTERRVYDDAGLFTSSQTESLEEAMDALSTEIQMDVVVVTTRDAEGKDARNYADDFYDQGDFGTGSDKSGILLLIDMDNREVYISTGGQMIRYLTDQRIDTMLDHAFDKVSSADYYAAADTFLKDTKDYVNIGIDKNQYNYDTETGKISRYRTITWFEGLAAFLIALACAMLPCINTLNQYQMKKQRKHATNYNLAYRAECNFSFRTQNDALLNQFVTQRRIPKNTGSGSGGHSSSGRSSTHTSSGGRSHGGGGRKF